MEKIKKIGVKILGWVKKHPYATINTVLIILITIKLLTGMIIVG